MEREILFRGKRVDNGEWAEGFYSAEEFNPMTCKIEHIPRIQQIGSCASYGIEPETLGRYTGLIDKKGRRIFEGDILDLTPYMITDVGVVKFGEYKDLDMGNDYPCGHVGFYVDVEKQRISVRKDILFFVSECKVVGNIHDDPELMGGGIPDEPIHDKK